jgi:hypothetical protein
VYELDKTGALMPLLDFLHFQADIAVLVNYDLSIKERLAVVAGTIMNRLEGVCEKRLKAIDVSPFLLQVIAARARLLKLFFKHLGCDLPQITKVMPALGSSNVPP